MKTFSIKDFSGGLVERISPEDRPPHTAQTLENFRIHTLGRLIKRAGYDEADLADTTYRNNGLGGATIRGVYEFSRDDPHSEIFYVIAASDNVLYKWSPTGSGTWTDQDPGDDHYPGTSIDYDPPDVPRFFTRLGVLRVACGDGAANYPLWYSYIERDFFNSLESWDAYYLSLAKVETADIAINTARTAATDGSLSEGYYFYKVSYIYDGFQEGLASAASSSVQVASPNDEVEVTIKLDWSDLNKRVSAVRVFRAYQTSSGTLSSDTTFYYLTDVDINTGTTDANWALDTGDIYEITISDDTDTITPSLAVKQGHTSTALWANYKYAAILKDRVFYAGLYDADGLQEDMVKYSFIDPDGNHCPDILTALNFINFSGGDADRITGLSTLLGKLVVYKENTIYRLSTGSGNELTWSVDEQWGNTGCVAPNTLAHAGDQNFFLSRDGVRSYDGVQCVVVSDPALTDTLRSLSNYWETAWGFYYQVRKEYWLHIQTAASTYSVFVVSVETGTWKEFQLEDQILGYTHARDGRVLTTEGSDILEQDTGTDDNGTSIEPVWKSNPLTLDASNLNKLFYTIYVTYKSDTPIRLKLYLDRSSTAAVSKSLPAQTTDTSVLQHLPLGTCGYEVEIEISLDTDQQAGNTQLEIAEIVIDYLPLRRVWT